MRSRLIAPGFFTNEPLARMPMEARILFAGLWCMADRSGVLLDSAKKIAGEVFPHDEGIDSRRVEKWLSLLADGPDPLILRYEEGGKKCIYITNFHKFQKPHPREKPSGLPLPGTTLGEPKVDLRPAQGEPVSVSVSIPVSIPVSVCPSRGGADASRTALGTPDTTPDQPHERLASELRDLWPGNRRGSPPMVQQALCEIVALAEDPPGTAAQFVDAARAYVESDEVQRGICKRLDRWIRDGDWRESVARAPAKQAKWARVEQLDRERRDRERQWMGGSEG